MHVVLRKPRTNREVFLKLFRISFRYFLAWKAGFYLHKEEIIALGGRSNYYYQAISTDQPQCISLDALLILHDSSDRYYKMTVLCLSQNQKISH